MSANLNNEQNNNKGKYNKVFLPAISTKEFLRVYILHLLNERDYYGREIVDEVSDRVSGVWKPSHGMLYPVLRELEDEGLVSAEWEEADRKTKRFYCITRLGKQELGNLLENSKMGLVNSHNMICDILHDLYGVSVSKISLEAISTEQDDCEVEK